MKLCMQLVTRMTFIAFMCFVHGLSTTKPWVGTYAIDLIKMVNGRVGICLCMRCRLTAWEAEFTLFDWGVGGKLEMPTSMAPAVGLLTHCWPHVIGGVGPYKWFQHSRSLTFSCLCDKGSLSDKIIEKLIGNPVRRFLRKDLDWMFWDVPFLWIGFCSVK